jgi:hypothetical protein
VGQRIIVTVKYPAKLFWLGLGQNRQAIWQKDGGKKMSTGWRLLSSFTLHFFCLSAWVIIGQGGDKKTEVGHRLISFLVSEAGMTGEWGQGNNAQIPQP